MDNNYFDETLEIELQHLDLPDNIKTKLYEKIELDLSDDEFFLEQESKLGKITVKDSEIISLTNLIDKKIEEEIEDEEKEKLKPIAFADSKDVLKAERILLEDVIIKKAFDCGMINFDEIVFFIDYYEIFSLINKSQTETIKNVKAISDLFKD